MACTHRTHSLPVRIGIYGALVLFSLWSLLPIFWVAMTSLRPNLGPLSGDNPFVFSMTWDNYRTVWEQTGFFTYLKNTIVISLGSTVLALVLGLPAAYGLVRLEIKNKRALSGWILSVRLSPPIAFVVSFFIMFKTLRILDTPLALTMVYTAFLLPFSIWLLGSFIREIPPEAEETALTDGCTRWGALFKVLLPQIRPAIGAVALLNLVAAWNEFLFALILTSSRAVTLPVAVSGFFGERGVLWGQVTAAAVLIMIVPLILSAVIHRSLIRGMSLGVSP